MILLSTNHQLHFYILTRFLVLIIFQTIISPSQQKNIITHPKNIARIANAVQVTPSKKMKMSVLVEEGLQRLRNCSRGLDASVRKIVMTAWATKLRRSGCPETVRHQVINEAVKKFKNMCDD